MEQILAEAAQSGDINALYHVLREDPTLLDKYDEPSFVDTPAHIAAAAGSTHFAVEVLRLKPSFRAKLNPDGYSPLDLALRRGKNRTVKWLIKHDPELIRVKGREGFTPLHYVAEVGDAELLADLLVACPQSIQDLTIRGETAVHIAVRNKNVRALQVLLGWLKRGNINGQILNWKDENGETALHIAASTNNFEAVKFLMNEVKINEQNFEGLTCLDTFMGLAITGDERIAKALRCAGAKRSSSLRPAKTFADILSSKEPFTRKVFRQMVELDASIDGLSSEMRNALLVVAVLFLTAAYEAVLTPPGGTSSGGDSNSFSNQPCNISSSSSFARISRPEDTNNTRGAAQMRGINFVIFVYLNTIIFAASLRIIFRLLPRTLYYYMGCVGIALSLSYSISIILIAPTSIPILAFAVLLILTGSVIISMTLALSSVQAFISAYDGLL
ncbi:ankyrin repeat-containing protein BDA1-like [Coffea arabica]|uniref:Ankyrin repeat-containing protein BDA1-like n=1 Tax=Coffea arabica TaxID=13443 RepID=A0A6P6STQ4_COFAR